MNDWILSILAPTVRTITYGIILLIILVPTCYYYFIIKPRRKWFADIWERQGEKTPVLVDRDVVVEKKVKGKNAHVYLMKRKKYAVPPPKEEYVIRYNHKSYVDYLRVGSDYIPMPRGIIQLQNGKKGFEFEPMPYDVSMQMISTEKMLEEMFAKKKEFMEKYGTLIGLGFICVLMIVLMSLYFDFVSSGVAELSRSTEALQGIASKIVGG